MIKTIRLSELKNIARIIAENEIKEHGLYWCIIDGEKVKVVK